MTRLQDNSLPAERGMHSSTIPGASRKRNYDFYKHNFLSSLPLALGGAQTPAALCHQPTVRSAHLSWPMHRGNEARALCGFGTGCQCPIRMETWLGCYQCLAAFTMTCSSTSPCQEANLPLSLIFLHIGDKSVWQSYLVVMSLKPVLRLQFGRQKIQSNHLQPYYPVLAVLDTSGKESDLVMSLSTCTYIVGLTLTGSFSSSENERELHTNKWIVLHLQTCQALKSSCSRQPYIAANWYVFL